MKHLHSTTDEIDRIWTVIGGDPQLFDAVPSAEAVKALMLQPCRLGRRYRRTVRCPVNGDGYWYLRRELWAGGQLVGSVVVPNTGGEL